jgi:predicted transcriptional regulator YdeE
VRGSVSFCVRACRGIVGPRSGPSPVSSVPLGFGRAGRRRSRGVAEEPEIAHEQEGIPTMPEDGVRFETRGPMTLVGVTLFGSPEHTDLAQAWTLFGDVAGEMEWVRSSKRVYGLQVYPPAFPRVFAYTYMACVELPEGMEVPLQMFRKDVPAAKYAVVESEDGVDGISEAYRWLYDEWMPESGYGLAFPFDFEQYDGSIARDDESEEVTVWVPIVERPPEEDVVEAEYGDGDDEGGRLLRRSIDTGRRSVLE